jgi:hypothetical protein
MEVPILGWAAKGQWICSKCRLDNNYSRIKCRNPRCDGQQPKSSTKLKRKGDWECCGETQFASRNKCRRCNKDKASTEPIAKTVSFRHGDWLCTKCDDHQFASRTQCRKCGTSRPVREDSDGEEINPCIICYERERNVAFLHGDEGHFICCKECAQTCETCPMCRKPVKKIIKIY